MSVCVSVQAVIFKSQELESSFLVSRYILTLSRSSLSLRSLA